MIQQKALGLLVMVSILIAACTPMQSSNEKKATTPENAVECTQDSNCTTAGCSSQLCVQSQKASGAITSCDYNPEYAHTGEYCGCKVSKCAWIANEKSNSD